MEQSDVLYARNRTAIAHDTGNDSAEIRWPNGKVETLQNLAPHAIYTVVEGEGIRETRPLPPPSN